MKCFLSAVTWSRFCAVGRAWTLCYFGLRDAACQDLSSENATFRPPPLNNNQSISVESGIANDQSESKFRTEFIQGGGEFMPGIFANDTLSDKSYSDF